MSDIYLQITETPTVVTLSAPVISGALSSTVTVANVVTVALDSNSLTALENVTVTVGAAVTISNFPSSQAVTFSNLALTDTQLRASAVTVSGTVTASISGTVPVSGTFWQTTQPVSGTFFQATQPVSLASTTVTVSSLPALAAGTAQIGSVTASISNTVPVSGTFWQTTQPASLASLPALAAGTAQIGSVTASISGTVPVSGTFYQATQPVSLTSLPALAAGTAQIGSVTASISNSVVTFYPAQGTTVTNSNFTSTTASTTLASAVAGREVLTVLNEGAGNLHISPGSTCTTVSYQVRLSSGDYWECPQGQLSLLHTAVFSSAGSTARVTEVS
jgi:hypothetical protein